MSTLTKILIILLTISSIFLCGIVVTYVANADNYRQKYNKLKVRDDELSEKAKDLTKQVNEQITKSEQLEDKLNAEITSLKAETDKLQINLNNSEREKAVLLQKVGSMASVVETTSQTAKQQTQLFEKAQEELEKVRAEQIKQKKALNETSASLLEKMAIIETLEAEKKRLAEEKTELRSRLDQLLRPTGEVAVAPVPVTPRKEIARPRLTTPPAVEAIGLKGLVTEVDLKNKMASISIGAADGVKEGMKFHVTRGDEFICDILILDVDTEEAVGILELVEQQPRVGDNVSTDFNL